MLKPHRRKASLSSEDFWPADHTEKEELLISSPCPPPSSVLAHAEWLNAWKTRTYAEKHVRPGSGMAATLATAIAVRRTAGKLPAWPTLETANVRRSKMAADLVSATESYDCTTGLILLGRTGSGKTVGAVHLLMTMWERSFSTRVAVPMPMFLKATDLAGARRGHALGEGEPEVVLDATEAPLLILDDLGQDPRNDNTVFEVIDARYDAKLPTVVTSGFPLEELNARYGQALSRRLLETNGPGKIVNLLKGQGLKVAK